MQMKTEELQSSLETHELMVIDRGSKNLCVTSSNLKLEQCSDEEKVNSTIYHILIPWLSGVIKSCFCNYKFVFNSY
jgi:hypothetical protein